ncbi:UDP-N-acetylmuramate dehydrogenase [Stigmatella aurantiaca]|uniref:UDP-N-acetylenolpyruvoylglucosamine reductase n=1 Tax=Stigmatella aurantiaca (strain DW4/3-1) TaxID=378806 RepID=Q09BM5_STIAD|nr:UDP-N-acetylmuramate dehydrogenase [Stigmatella aurantiaca]EAU69115.1 UDP-N-acetylenolpyruvoylglucosamine reductase [Stigmatella aurantiaca DW4/3-1]
MVSRTPSSLPERIALLGGCEVKAGEPLAPLTSVRVGGPAEALVRPRGPEALVALLKLAREEGTPVTLLGGGANTLVGDGGIPGITVRLPGDLFPEAAEVGDEEGRLTLGAGAAIVRLINLMRTHGLVGAEFLAGIPGTLGGAVAMNAGTKNGECFRVLEAVEVATADGVGWLTKAQVPHAYRHSELPVGGVVTRVRFLLRKGDVVASKQAMDTDLGYRKRTQPLSQPNFGSVFTNPIGDFAGRLIERVNLKGHTLGRAQVSPLHANWIVNLGGATARDVLGLITLMQQRVREQEGVELKPEVKRVGEFPP